MNKTLASIVIVAALAAVLTGCASGPKYAEISSSIPTLQADQGRVYFFRSSSMMGAGIQPDIRLNDQVVGTSQPGGFFFVDRPAGQYNAATSTETEKTVSFALDAGEIKYVRTSISFGLLAGRVIPSLETSEVAVKELPELSYTGNAISAKQAK